MYFYGGCVDMMEGMKLNDWFQKEFYQIDHIVFCMLVSKHGFLINSEA